MLLDCDYKFVDSIDIDLLTSVDSLCMDIDWTNKKFSRFETPLKKGRLIVLPYFIKNPAEYYTGDVLQIADHIKPIVDCITKHYPNCTVLKGEVAYVPPGNMLDLHIDNRWFHKHSHRIHVPIRTNEQCFQVFHNTRAHLELGKIYEINNRITHSAVNNSTEPRIHLILDICPNIKCVDITVESALIEQKNPFNGKEVN